MTVGIEPSTSRAVHGEKRNLQRAPVPAKQKPGDRSKIPDLRKDASLETTRYVLRSAHKGNEGLLGSPAR